MSQPAPTPCVIEYVGKQRNGKFRFWCSMHRASATGRYGARLDRCEGAYRHLEHRRTVEIDPADYPGGIAMWGAVPAAYDTTSLPVESGVHIHARGHGGGSKEIDDTFDVAVIAYRRDLVSNQLAVITSEVAVAYYLSRFVGHDIRALHCTHCDEVHLDSGYFAVKPHQRHLCHGCGKYFFDTSKAVSNPLAALNATLGRAGPPAPVRAPRTLVVEQKDFKGGLQVWASNPALIWTAERPEEQGLHVHGFRSPGEIDIDETYSSVSIDGILLNEQHVRHFMAQNALPHLSGKLAGLQCPACSSPHFDVGNSAFYPHMKHRCEHCEHLFTSPHRAKLVVSNPFVSIRDRLRSRL